MFKEAAERLLRSVEQLSRDKVSLVAAPGKLTDFGKRKESYTLQAFLTSVKETRKTLPELNEFKDAKNSLLRNQIFELMDKLDSKNIAELQKTAEKIAELANQLPKTNKTANNNEIKFNIPKRIPEEIAAEVLADMQELQKCFENGCYRSSIILCGRLLETALHRKYFEATNFDILEKNPGIGLGNLIAKLDEKNVKLDPGLTQQIHLINQVRIFSVHKKKESFNPSREQTMAIILFTTDSLNKLLR